MYTKITALLVVLFMIPACSQLPPTLTHIHKDEIPDLVQKVKSSVYQIDVYRNIGFSGAAGLVIRSGHGTGFVVNKKKKWMVTCFHVVDGAEKLYAIQGDRKFEVKVLYTNPKQDLALLEAKTDDDLHEVPLGDSDSLQVGERVFAIGSAQDFPGSVTFGRISGLKRKIPDLPEGENENVIQTDCPINAGNSGGPLFNMKGEVVGVPFYGYWNGENLAFCIPSKYVKQLIEIYVWTEEIHNLIGKQPPLRERPKFEIPEWEMPSLDIIPELEKSIKEFFKAFLIGTKDIFKVYITQNS